MPYSNEFTNKEPYVSFLAAYPFPAFVLRAKERRGRHGTALRPVYGNIPFLRLVFGPEMSTSQSLAEHDSRFGGLVESLLNVDEARRLSGWIQPSVKTDGDAAATTNPTAEHTIRLSLRPSWLPAEHAVVQLEVTKTLMDRFWVCTSVPRTELPVISVPPSSSLASPSQTPRKSPNLRLPNFPPPSVFTGQTPMPTPQPQQRDGPLGEKQGIFLPGLVSSPSPYAGTGAHVPLARTSGSFAGPSSLMHNENVALSTLEASLDTYPIQVLPPPSRPGEMDRMVESFPWEKTDLGPREGWSQALKTALSICLRSPSSCALWWGPSLVMIYNDGYAEMAASKHPRIFGMQGAVAWAEIWEQVGHLSEFVMGGESVAKWDDLLFFERLTADNLPEELYHSWSWIPVRGENGAVQGILNWSIETTEKVIAERRLLTLRTMGEGAKLAKNVLQLTSALLSSLEKNTEDVPFAAFYYCQSVYPVPPRRDTSGSGSSSSYIRTSVDQPPVQISYTLTGSIGIPETHAATPVTRDLLLDPVTLRPIPSPRMHPRPGSAHTSRDSGSISVLNLNSTPIGRIASPTSSLSSVSPSTVPIALPPLSSAVGGHDTPSSVSDHSTAASPSLQSTMASTIASASSASSASTSWMWPITEAVSSRRPVLVPSLPAEVAESLSRRSWGDKPRQAVIVPIWAFEGENADSVLPKAVLVLGLNPRRPYDKDYEEWVDVFGMSLGVSLAAVLSWEAETLRGEQLAQLDAAKTSFFSNASHELRTPLTLILGPIQDAATESTNPKIREKLKLALRNVSRLSRLVDSLMDFTRIEAGKLLGHFKPVQLGAFTADLASLFRSTIEKSRIDFNVECDVTILPMCYVDPELWEKIVFNLIGNAFKYTMEGAITVRIVHHMHEVVFTVEDTGVGIPTEDVSNVFQRFHRVSSICRSHEGTGIGLSLTKELVRLHGGTISVSSRTATESSDGSHGSIFTVTLPLGKDHLPPNHVDESVSETHRHQHQHYARGIVEEATLWSRSNNELVKTPSDSSSSDSAVSPGEGSRMDASTLFFLKKDVILLVDDNGDMRQYIKSIFVQFCSVIEATHGQEALDLIDGGLRPDLVLSDVMMPVLDGYGLVKALRERSETKLLPIILLTAKAGEESRVGGLLSGADDYIAKPFQGRELVARVHLQMQLGKRRAELEARFEERQREIKILSDHSPIGIVRTDPNGRITYVNPRWFELTGRDRLPLDDWFESVHPDHTKAVHALWKQVFQERAGGSLEFRWTNGFWTKGQMVPLGEEKNGWTGVLFTITDISDQRLYEASQLSHAQEREATARRRAEEAEERRKEADERRRGQELLIDVTSHELRQPVSAILNCSALVRKNLASLRDELRDCSKQGSNFVPRQALLGVIEEDLEALDSIYQCGLAQERIANDVLSLSRIQLQVLSIHPVEFELVREVRQIVAIFHNELKMKQIRMILHFGESIQRFHVRRVWSDKSRFAQVITNLLSNAIKFTDTSVEKREIQVTLDVSFKPPKAGTCVPPDPTDDDFPDDLAAPIYLYVAVKDSGPGLKPDDLNLLFKRFQQGSNSHDVFGGSGLGLFVSRQLCELMDGKIDVDSIYGNGATFRFFIQASNSPIGPDPPEISNGWLDNDDHIVITESVAKPGTVIVPTARPFPAHILITEDNLINQTVLNRQLKSAGFLTTLASHGQQAIDQVRALASRDRTPKAAPDLFDAILMDCEMPVMDGLTAVREIRRLEESGELPGRNRIFALTGNARSGQIQSARDAGMDDVLIKPYKLDELLSKLRGR